MVHLWYTATFYSLQVYNLGRIFDLLVISFSPYPTHMTYTIFKYCIVSGLILCKLLMYVHILYRLLFRLGSIVSKHDGCKGFLYIANGKCLTLIFAMGEPCGLLWLCYMVYNIVYFNHVRYTMWHVYTRAHKWKEKNINIWL